MFKKLITVASLVALSTPAFAIVCNSPYVGLQIGQSELNYRASDLGSGVASSGGKDETGPGWNVLLGYQFNNTLSTEFSFTHFDTAEFKNINGSGDKGRIRSHAFDLMGRARFPMGKYAAFYVRAGVALLYATANDPTGVSSNLNTSAFRPAYGAGFTYDFSQNVSGILGYTQINSGSGLQTSNLASFGLQYHF